MDGLKKPELQALTTVKDRITFLYVERCKISRDSGAITIHDEQGTKSIPAAMVSALLLGPGTDISHRAVELIGDAGASIVWGARRQILCKWTSTHKSCNVIVKASKVCKQ